MDTTVADPLLGVLVDGRYRVRSRVARGGMATVYTATDERLERTVALKIIHPSQAHDPNFVDRFTGEAKTIARLTHPNVVAVYDQGRHDGLPYLIMEYVRGRTLRELLTDRRRLAPLDALAILEQMLAAVAAAHRAGLVHRDVKPENVLVAESPGGRRQSTDATGTHIGSPSYLVDSVVKVADFGLARAVEASADEGGSHLMATVAYVAPELVADGHADPRADVYSAGVVLFEMLTGRVPYEGDQPVDVAWQHVERTVPAPSHSVPGLPPELDNLVARATQREPSGRPSDAGVMLAEVQAARDTVSAAMAAQTRPLAEPTVIVPCVTTGGPAGDAETSVSGLDRPSWARLPAARTQSSRTQPARSQSTRSQSTRSQSTRSQSARHGGGTVGVDQPGAGLYGGGTYRGARSRRNTGLTGLWALLRRDRRARLATAGALVVLVVLVAFGGWWLAIGRYTDAPALVSRGRADAAAVASGRGFTVRFSAGQYDETVPKDVVLAQRPGPGARIVSGGQIVLTLSLGQERYTVPDQIVGQVFDLATEDLQRLKLQVKRADRFDDNVPQGSVVTTEPPPGTVVKRDTVITVWVSKGRAPITVPNVVGKNVNDAKDALQRLKLSVDVKSQDSDKPKDQVLSQDPVDGAGVEAGAKITLTVSKGPPMAVIPDVRGKSADEARQILEGLGLRVHLLGVGTVRLQSPNPNDQVQPGSEVTIFATP